MKDSPLFTTLTTRRGFLAQAILVPTTFALAGCGSGGGNKNQPGVRSASAKWASMTLEAIAGGTIGPPMNARAIAIVSTAAYDAWSCYDGVAVSTQLGATLRRPAGERTQGNKDQAVSYAAYRALVDLYPAQKAKFDTLMTQLGYDPANTSMDTTTATGVGNKCADALLTFRHNDGSNQLNTYADNTGYYSTPTGEYVTKLENPVRASGAAYTVPPKPQFWEQLRFPNNAAPPYIGPHWGNVTPFSFTRDYMKTNLRPGPPPEYGSTEYMRQLNDVVKLTADLTSAQRKLVEYWADGPRSVQPPGHWLLFALRVSDRDGYGIDDAVKLFFILGNAEMDAGIGCWDCKRFYNLARPITAIRALSQSDPVLANWAPAQADDFQTPPFPEYTSGHSTFSAAGAEILKRYTGSDVYSDAPTNETRVESLVPTWNTFSEIADQAGASRRFGGIHFETADIAGRQMGRKIGGLVWDKALSYINGSVGTV
jgi:hypothetical protein